MSESCALDVHGALKDADDNVIMNNVTSNATTLLKSPALAVSLNAFSVLLQKGSTSVRKTASAHHSSCPSKPSGCFRDAQEAGTIAVTKTIKRPTTTDDEDTVPIQKSRKATVENADDTDDDTGHIFDSETLEDLPDLIYHKDNEDNDPQVAYEHTKVMGDADCEECSYLVLPCF
jgi:hypothetical protein